MLRSLYLCLIYGMFLCSGMVAPFALGLGYVWVDTFTPQNVAYALLTDMPVSAIMAIGAIGAYLLFDRKAPPRPNLIFILIVAMGFYVTYTTYACAVVPVSAWEKWDWAIKTIGFAAFMPYLFRSRVQIEAFLLVYVFSAAVQVIPYGIKTIISGGSYHANLGLLVGNSGLAEGATLSAVAIMGVPLLAWLRSHTTILPRSRLTSLMFLGMMIACVSASVGTAERTGLIAIVVGAVALWLRARHKIRYALLGMLVLSVLLGVVIRPDSDWAVRMSTITQFNHESSSLGRILVWQWTLDFVSTHPLGGGFNSFIVDTVTLPAAEGGTPVVIHGKAFHSMYFEMLGENGWPGLALYLGLFLTSFMTQLRVARRAAAMQDMAWCRDLAYAIMASQTILMASGLFVGIAYQPEVWYVFAMTAMLSNHLKAVQRQIAPRAIQPMPDAEMFGFPA